MRHFPSSATSGSSVAAPPAQTHRAALACGVGRGRAGGASGACACRFSAGELALIEVPVTSDLAASADLRLERTTAAAIVARADRAPDMLAERDAALWHICLTRYNFVHFGDEPDSRALTLRDVLVGLPEHAADRHAIPARRSATWRHGAMRFIAMPAPQHHRAMSAVRATSSRIRSSGASSTSHPGAPPLMPITGHSVAVSSMTTGNGLRAASGVTDPRS